MALTYQDWDAKASEHKTACQAILERASSEGRELDAIENNRFETERAGLEVAQQMATQLRDAEIENMRSRFLVEPAAPQSVSLRDSIRNMLIGAKGGEVTITNALVAGSGSGSYLVPQEWHDSVAEYRFQRNFLRQVGAQVIKTNSTHNIPVLSANGVAAITAENAAYTDCSATIAQVVLGAYKVTIKTPVSEELLEDSAYDVAGVLARSVGLSFGAAEEKYFLTGGGSGCSQPTGIFNKAADKTLAACTAITGDEIIEAYYGLARHYRENAVWMMNDVTTLAIAKLKLTVTTSGTLPYFWTDPANGEPAKLMGRPIYTNSDISALPTGGGTATKIIAFGDPSMYAIGERGALTAKRLQLNEYSDTFAFAHRIDGAPLDTSAFYVVASHA